MPVITLPVPGVTPDGAWAPLLNTAITDVNTQVDANTAAIATKITAFADPNADRIVFWDDSAGAFAALTASTGLTISGTTMSVAVSSATVQGIVELATTAETTTGTDTARAVTPAGVKAVADTQAALSHTHAASDIASGTVATARLGSGTADSTKFLRGDQTWAVPAGGGGSGGAWPPLGTAAGLVNYTFAINGATPGGQILGNNSSPDVLTFYIGRSCSLRSWALRVETAGAAGSLIKLWLYKESGALGTIPDTLVQDLGSVAGDSTNNGVKVTLGSPLALTPGWHSIILGTDTTGTSPTISAWAASTPPLTPGRTADLTRIDFATRSGTRASGVSMTGSAPSTIAWAAPPSTPNINDASGIRVPVVTLDFI